MGNSESTIIEWNDKKLIRDGKGDCYWITTKNGNEVTRIPVRLSIRYLTTDKNPLRTDIPLIVDLPIGRKFVWSRTLEVKVTGPSSFEFPKLKDGRKLWDKYLPDSSPFDYMFYCINYSLNGVDMIREFQVYNAERSGELVDAPSRWE